MQRAFPCCWSTKFEIRSLQDGKRSIPNRWKFIIFIALYLSHQREELRRKAVHQSGYLMSYLCRSCSRKEWLWARWGWIGLGWSQDSSVLSLVVRSNGLKLLLAAFPWRSPESAVILLVQCGASRKDASVCACMCTHALSAIHHKTVGGIFVLLAEYLLFWYCPFICLSSKS